MSGLRAAFAYRFPSSPPRRRPPCTPAREGRIFERLFQSEGHPATRRVLSAERSSCLRHLCSGLRAVKVSCREGFHTRPMAVRTPAPKATASPPCCPFALARDTTTSRCGASTPCRATCFYDPTFAPCVIFACGSVCEPWVGRTPASLGQGHAVVNAGVPLLGDVSCAVDCFPWSRSSCRACVPRAGVEARAPWRPSQAHPSGGTKRRAPTHAPRGRG
jgi:hypothetical protein